MGLITKSRLKQLTETQVEYKSFSNRITEAKNIRASFGTKTVFLSHCHDDKEEINQAVVFLRDKGGASIYIDWLDPSMPATTNADTAGIIKTRINACKKFILLATNNAINSKWCNWELGYGDAIKSLNNIALLVLSENSGTWHGTEYLRLYPRIEESNFVPDHFKVIYPNGTDVSLYSWFNS